VLKQLKGQTLKSGMKVTYMGLECLVVGVPDDVGELGNVIGDVSPDLEYLTLIDASFVDLDK
tara:strand:- start:9540 stop:9725 length:186 start_codon:yes stop_codon:yes gene_type:complete